MKTYPLVSTRRETTTAHHEGAKITGDTKKPAFTRVRLTTTQLRHALTWASMLLALTAAVVVRPAAQDAPVDPIKVLVDRLDLEQYKATLKGLTAFGDRRQGTDRNRAAVDWIEARLRSYGCPTDRIQYVWETPPPRDPNAAGR